MTYKEQRDMLLNLLGTITENNGGEFIVSMGEYNRYKERAKADKLTFKVSTLLDRNIILMELDDRSSSGGGDE